MTQFFVSQACNCTSVVLYFLVGMGIFGSEIALFEGRCKWVWALRRGRLWTQWNGKLKIQHEFRNKFEWKVLSNRWKSFLINNKEWVFQLEKFAWMESQLYCIYQFKEIVPKIIQLTLPSNYMFMVSITRLFSSLKLQKWKDQILFK